MLKILLSKSKILYLFFGICTTLLNFLAYVFASRILEFAPTIATMLAWVVAVSFAYVVNRKFVFVSLAHNLIATIKEILSFYAMRILTGILEVGAMYIFAEILGIYDIAVKIFTLILVVVSNYILSKFVVFKGEQC